MKSILLAAAVIVAMASPAMAKHCPKDVAIIDEALPKATGLSPAQMTEVKALRDKEPFNLLLMDEPTNDLDVETLELLEELLMQYEGTLILVSHDRAFLDNVVTSTLVFEGDAQVNEYVGGYEDWLRQSLSRQSSGRQSATVGKRQKKAKPAAKKSNKRLSFRDQRELDQLPALIDSLVNEQAELANRMSAADFHQQDRELIATTTDRLSEIEKALSTAYQRWEQLESDGAK